MSITAQEVLDLISEVDAGLDLAVRALGQSELQPIIDAIAALAKKAISAATSQNPVVATEVVAADSAAEAAEDVKFGLPGQGPK